MSNLELFYKRDKNKWVCYDRLGRRAEGITKDIARNLWHIYYEEKKIISGTPNINDIDKVKL